MTESHPRAGSIAFLVIVMVLGSYCAMDAGSAVAPLLLQDLGIDRQSYGLFSGLLGLSGLGTTYVAGHLIAPVADRRQCTHRGREVGGDRVIVRTNPQLWRGSLKRIARPQSRLSIEDVPDHTAPGGMNVHTAPSGANVHTAPGSAKVHTAPTSAHVRTT